VTVKKVILTAAVVLNAGAFALVLGASSVLAAAHSGAHSSGQGSGHGTTQRASSTNAPTPVLGGGGGTTDAPPCWVNVSTCVGN
jgi:hypothetical protein